MAQQEESAYENALQTVQKGIPKLFPHLRSGTVFLYADGAHYPALALCSLRRLLSRHQSLTTCEFDGVGSLVAQSCHQPDVQLVVQCRPIINHWTECACDEITIDSTGSSIVPSAHAMKRYRVQNPESALAGELMQMAKEIIGTTLFWGLPQLRLIDLTVAEGSFEFWTLVEDGFQRQ